MFVTRKKYRELHNQWLRTQDQLDQCLGQNETLLKFCDGERERYDDLLSAFLNVTQRDDEPWQPTASVDIEPLESPPKAVLDAIARTFPGDDTIRSANMAYAYSQAHRWTDDAELIAQEILQGDTV